jgi:superfamily II DNA or RNA helicase
MKLRPYQAEIIERLRASIRRGVRRLLLQLPTGAGKTVIAAEIIHGAGLRGKKILFLAHRRELIDQCSEKLTEFGVDHGIIRASDRRRKPWLSVHVCSVPTLARRENLPAADILVIDEAHRSAAESYRKVSDQYPNAVVLGLSATPQRTDGKGLGTLFEELVCGPSIQELTKAGYLVPTKIFGHPLPDLSDVHIQAGDYKSDELAIAMNKPKLVGSLTEHWLKLAENRQTIAFTVSIEHSKSVVEDFRRSGVACEHLDGGTPDEERAAILRRLRSGETRVVSNVGIMTEGFDCPPVSCLVLARPTCSVCLYLQMVGRALRPYPGKSNCLILDHAGCVSQHSFPDEDRDWSLDDRPRKKKNDDDLRALSVRMCKQCWLAYPSTMDKCPGCGAVHEKQAREIEHEVGELQELKPGQWLRCSRCRAQVQPVSGAEYVLGQRHSLFCAGRWEAHSRYEIKKLSDNTEVARLQKIAAERGYKQGWIWGQIRRKRLV